MIREALQKPAIRDALSALRSEEEHINLEDLRGDRGERGIQGFRGERGFAGPPSPQSIPPPRSESSQLEFIFDQILKEL